ncbi:ABC transporter ATP-binding protein [Pontibacillus litoralis]|uniref:ABC transporter domain-containing protein n=1 Tax=Pontibacillus litoralis JSM 072002 TaxID=1385512 RepID=A0A0A5HUU2_9BACI|nr:ABC transporter ATP-binding protein [Pontibacillus litoralis]KGX87402.1 hypothetical protein N784_15735 [Pontibacillus litoralis JSM 072002]
MIELVQIEKYYKRKQVLAIPSFSIESGAAYGILGPNGAGKSTLLKLIASIEKPTKGTLYFNGQPYRHVLKQVRQSIGYIPQDIALYPELTVTQQMDFWLRLSWKQADQNFLKKMKRTLRLDEVAHKRLNELSGGWQRKLNLCIGMIHNPNICLFDEPTVGVDIAAKEDIIEWLSTLHNEGKTLLYISHDRYELERLSDHYVVMANGTMLFHGDKSLLQRNKDTILQHDSSHQELTKILSHL